MREVEDVEDVDGVPGIVLWRGGVAFGEVFAGWGWGGKMDEVR